MTEVFALLVLLILVALPGCSEGAGPPPADSPAERQTVESPSSEPSAPDADPPWWQTQPVGATDAEPATAGAEQDAAGPSEEETVAGPSNEPPEGSAIPIGSDLKLTPPSDWVRQTPRVRFIEAEFAVPASEGDEEDGRVTVMAAGGTVEANIQRWFGQFTQPDGTDTKERGTVEEKTIADHQVHLVDVTGTFRDQAGPFAPAVERPGYRMLAAIIETDQANYFVKFYGPEKTVSEHAEAFHTMMEGLEKR